MIEARIFINEIDGIRERLEAAGATNRGRYSIDDTVYRNIDTSITLGDEFLRLRVIPENIWDEKPVILALKQTRLRKVGKNSHIPLKLQFDTKGEAEEYYEAHLKNDFIFDFSFSRIGWQYFLSNGDVVDLEIIEDEYPSIELKSETDDGLERLLGEFGVKQAEVIAGPSVVAVRDVLKR